MNNEDLPNLGEGFDWLQIAVPVNLNQPATADEVTEILTSAYNRAVAARTGVTA